MPRPHSERLIVFLVGAVQFINVLDFMMVMPLGPDFALALGVPASEVGHIGGAYTAAAAVAGLVGAFVMDRFDRRKALAVTMAGLGLGTFAGGLATGFTSLLLTRVVAGLFGGPATAIAYAIVADVVPAERRGRAMGAVMGAVSIASVLGVPASLRLAEMAGWQAPFFAVAGLGLVVVAGAVLALPPLVGHLKHGAARPRLRDFTSLLSRPVVLLSYTCTALAMAAGFAVIPNISSYVQFNLSYPRDHIDLLYMVGGAVSFVMLRLMGRAVDKYGSPRVATVAALSISATIYLGFAVEPSPLPVLLIFVLFMASLSSRNVAYSTLTTKVPLPAERARFMSLQSSVQHFASAAGAMLSARLLHLRPDQSLEGMGTVAAISIALSLALPCVMWLVDRQIRRRTEPASANASPAVP